MHASEMGPCTEQGEERMMVLIEDVNYLIWIGFLCGETDSDEYGRADNL